MSCWAQEFKVRARLHPPPRGEGPVTFMEGRFKKDGERTAEVVSGVELNKYCVYMCSLSIKVVFSEPLRDLMCLLRLYSKYC